jgi:phage shock protein C
MKKLYRWPNDRWLAGIFGGAGQAFDIDPTLLRLVALFVGVATGIIPLLVTYIIAWIVIPLAPPSQY